MMTLEELFEGYGRHLGALNRAQKTVRQYVQWSRRFFDFTVMLGIKSPAEVTLAHLHAYQNHLANLVNKKGRIFSIKVQNQHLTGIAMFLKYLCAEGLIASNPAQPLQYAKVPQRLPRAILTVAETKRLLNAPDSNTALGFRDKAIMEVLYSTGIRRQELINLNVQDIDLESGLVTVRMGKGGKDRVVPLGRIAGKCVETYITGIRPMLLQMITKGTEEKALFLSARGLRLSRNALADRIEHHRQAAKIPQSVTPHTFRHSVATHMIRNRANIRHVQEMLGHANLNTTEQYLHLTITDLKEAHSRFHPREKDS